MCFDWRSKLSSWAKISITKMPTTLYGEHIVRKSIGNCCSHAAEIARFHILRCCLGTLSVVPTLQKLHDFAYCAAALKPYQLFPRCRNCTISHIVLLPWNPINCSHAVEIARFRILRCCLETLPVVPTLHFRWEVEASRMPF